MIKMSEQKWAFMALVQTFVIGLCVRGELTPEQAVELNGMALKVDERGLLSGPSLAVKAMQMVLFERAKCERPTWLFYEE